MPIYSWSQTAATNATADATINQAEGMAPSAVNDSARAMMAAVAKWRDDNDGSLVTGGTSTAFTLTTNSVYTTLALLDGHRLTFKVNATSGASPTLNVDGLGAKAINHTTSVAISTGALISGSTYTVIYRNSTTEFILEGQVAAIPGNLSIGGTLAVTGVATLTAIPVFTAGIASATATTQTTTDSSTKVATTAFVQNNKPSAPTVQRFTSGSGTYTPTSGTVRFRVRMIGGGGGGGAASTNAGSVGTDSSFGSWTAIHGNGGNTAAGNASSGGTGGATGTGTLINRVSGGGGQGGSQNNAFNPMGGMGGNGAFGGAGAGAGSNSSGQTGQAAAANSGAGGGGGNQTGTTGGGGGAGEYVEFWATAGTTYAVGGGGNGGSAGGFGGGNGAAGIIVIEEFYV